MAVCRRCKKEYGGLNRAVGTEWCSQCYKEVSAIQLSSKHNFAIFGAITKESGKKEKIIILNDRELIEITPNKEEIEEGGRFHPRDNNSVVGNVARIALMGGLTSGSQKANNILLAANNRHMHLYSCGSEEIVHLYPDAKFIPYSDFKSLKCEKAFFKGINLHAVLADNSELTYKIISLPRKIGFKTIVNGFANKLGSRFSFK